MKKYFVYLMMALAAFTFNACGDDDPLQEEPGTEQPEPQVTRLTIRIIRMTLPIPMNLRETATS